MFTTIEYCVLLNTLLMCVYLQGQDKDTHIFRLPLLQVLVLVVVLVLFPVLFPVLVKVLVLVLVLLLVLVLVLELVQGPVMVLVLVLILVLLLILALLLLLRTTTHYQLSTTYYPLPTTHYPLLLLPPTQYTLPASPPGCLAAWLDVSWREGSGVAPHSDGRNFFLTAHFGLSVPEEPRPVLASHTVRHIESPT